MNLEVWTQPTLAGIEYGVLMSMLVSPVLVFVGIRAIIFEYRMNKLMSKSKTA